MKNVTRRDFVKSTFAAGLAAALPYSRAQGANDRIRVGLVVAVAVVVRGPTYRPLRSRKV